MLTEQPWDLLRPLLVAAGDEADAAIERLQHYARLLIDWNRRVSNILSRNDEDRIVERHLLESVAPARWLASFGYRRWIDFGSGAGLPAIPLAVAGVSGAWCLVEVRRIKALFIRKAIHAIGLCDFTVANERLEHLSRDPALRGTFDAFTSRATMRLGPTLALAAPLVGLGGSAFLWKGSGRAREMEADRAWQRSWTLAGAQAVGIVPLSVCRFSRISTG